MVRALRAACALATLIMVAPPLPAMQQDPSAHRSRIGLDVATVIEPDSLDRATFSDLAELLQARVPGLSVTRRGDGSTLLHMRGPASLYAENAPLVLVDGVRISLARSRFEEFLGRPNPLDHIDVEQIERVEVLSGPSATALYGTGAANGVIAVVTRDLRAMPTQWRAFVTGGALDEPGSYPAVYTRAGTYGSGRTDFCRRIDEASGDCTPTGSTTSFNPLEDESLVGAAPLMRVGGSMAGGSERAAWYAAATMHRQGSMTDGIGHRRAHAHVAARVRTSSATALTLRAHWMEGDTPLATPVFESLRQQGLLYFGSDTSWTGFRRYPEPEHDLSRRGVSLAADWRATTWLRGAILTGLDRSSGSDRVAFSETVGYTRSDYVRQRRTDFTGRMSVEAAYGLGSRVRARTAAIADAIEHRHDDLFEHALGGPGGTSFARGLRSRDDESAIGIAVHQELSYRDRAALQVGLRHEDLDTFGFGWKTPWYPHASLTWIMVPERAGALSSVRLRAGYGKAGMRPSTDHLAFSFPPPWAQVEPLERKVEVTTEREGGIDVSFLHRRADLSLTWYSKRTTDALMSFEAPGYMAAGFGEVLNRGIEGSLRLRLLDAGRAGWNVRVGYAHNHNEAANAYGFGLLTAPFPVMSGRQTYRQSAPLGAYTVWRVASTNDADGDGVLETSCFPGEGTWDERPCEVQYAPGPDYRAAFPPTQLSLESALRFGPVTAGLLIDHRRGHYLHNVTEALRCLATCASAYATSLSDVDAIRLASTYQHYMFRSGAFVEKATFTKLRELSLRIEAPSAWAGKLGARRVEISLAGRNLATWTDYSGMDPEASSLGDEGLAVGDFASAPLPRSVSVRITLRQ